jgi:hypothetical protein
VVLQRFLRPADAEDDAEPSDVDRSSSDQPDHASHAVAPNVVVLSLEQVRHFRTKRLSSRDTVTHSAVAKALLTHSSAAPTDGTASTVASTLGCQYHV